MRHFRGYRGSRSRSMSRPMIKTYKKILNFLELSVASGFRQEILIKGVDSSTMGQLTNVDPNVPTGARVKFIEVQFCISNLAAIHCYINCSLQYTLSNQAARDPQALGGNNQRNQVLHQDLFVVGKDQNSTHKFKFRIPPKFQRMREDMLWSLVWSTNQTVNRSIQVIYKVEL